MWVSEIFKEQTFLWGQSEKLRAVVAASLVLLRQNRGAFPSVLFSPHLWQPEMKCCKTPTRKQGSLLTTEIHTAAMTKACRPDLKVRDGESQKKVHIKEMPRSGVHMMAECFVLENNKEDLDQTRARYLTEFTKLTYILKK